MVDISKLKFRHLFGELYKKKFEHISPSTSSSESCGIKGNPNFFAFSWKTSGGGALAVFQNHNYQKFQKVPPLITGHSGQILDFEFYPFNDNQIATASEDCSIKFWELPEQINEDITEPVTTLNGHQKKVQLIAFNQISSNVLASASADSTIKLWNLEKSSQNLSIPVADQSWALQWNITGNLLGLINKDKQWRIMDPRACQIVSTTKAHSGPKNQSLLNFLFQKANQEFAWIGEQHCLTTGLSKSFERQFYLYDIRNTEKPIQTQVLDNSSGTLFPFYDYDTNILFLAGKGDANIRYYEFCENQLIFCSNFSTTKSGMGYGFYSKRSVNVNIHEIMRGLKLTDSTVEFIKFCAPRKSEQFQEDLFPDTIGNVPSQSAEDFFANKDAPAILVSLNPNSPNATTVSSSKKIIVSKDTSQNQSNYDNNKDTAMIQTKLEQLQKENQELRNQNTALSFKISQLQSQIKKEQGSTNQEEDDKDDLLEKIENEQQKNTKLQFQINVLQQKVFLLEKSVSQNENESENYGKDELEFVQNLQKLIQEREKKLKIQLNQE